MKSADTSTRLGSQGHAPAGPGASITFRCAKCCKPKQTMGRKLRFLQGLRQFVCAACDQAMPKPASSPAQRYEAGKQAYAAKNPNATPEQYEQAMRDIAKRAGI